MNNEFEKKIADKLHSEVSRDFDQDFWNKFEKIKETRKPKLFSLKMSLSFVFSAALILIVALAGNHLYKNIPTDSLQAQLSELSEYDQILVEMDKDLFNQLEDEELWNEVLASGS